MVTKRSVAAVAILGCAFAAGGCARRGPEAEAERPAAASAVPSGSKLAQVKAGMSPEEVQRILGEPTSRNAYVTGKAFIPFYFGPDQTRTGWFYKGLGRVVFSGSGGFGTASRVQRVEYDPNEDGRP